jgi:exosortase/archaeosortase family protein
LIALLFLPILFFGNALRIMASVLIGYNFSAKSSEFFHDTFGQILIFVWVILCFIVWLKITKNFPKEKMEVIK